MPPRRRNARPVPAAPEPPPEDTEAAREGYDYQLAEKPPTSLQTDCPICQLLLRDPHQLKCCGKLICSPCLERALARGHESCPLCRNSEVHSFPDNNHRRMVEGLRAYCRHRPREGEHSGCEWVGELGEVEKHLNCTLSRGNRTKGCQYVLLKCKYCKEDVVRSSLEEHESSLCSKRIVKCPFCDYFGEYTDVNGPHKKSCPNFPVVCQHCKRMVGKHHIKQHVSNKCPMTTIACELEGYGCNKTFPRKDMAAHMEKNHAVHLKMVINHMKVAEQRHKEELARLSSEVVSLRSENHETNGMLLGYMRNSYGLSYAKKLDLGLHNAEQELKKKRMVITGLLVIIGLIIIIIIITQTAAIALEPLTTHPDEWAEPSHK